MSEREPDTQESLDVPRRSGLSTLTQGLGDWICERLELRGDDALHVRFTSHEGDLIDVQVLSKNSLGPSFRRLSHCVVRYTGQIRQATDRRKAEASALVLGVAGSVNARLATLPEGTSIATALGKARDAATLTFSRLSLRALIAPEIVDGIPIAGGWALADVYPTSYVREKTGARLELVLDFHRESDDRRMLIIVAAREGNRAGFAQTEHFVLSQLSLGASEPEGGGSLRAMVSFILQLRDHPNLNVVFPDVMADLRLAQLEAPDAEGPSSRADSSLNLAINAECDQSCAFCSIKQTAPAEDGGSSALQRYLSDLTASRAKGVRRLRLNGYDPLAYSQVLDVLRHAKKLGFDHVNVFSPCTRLADAGFLRDVLAALPAQSVFTVPLYGVTPAVHDAVVGRQGAHGLVMRAIDGIIAMRGARAVEIITVTVKQSLTELAALRQFARERGLAFSGHMPYPSFESRADRFYRATPRQTDVVLAMAGLYTANVPEGWALVGIAPCIILRALRTRGVRPHQWILADSESMGQLPGTEYADTKFKHGAGQREDAAFVASSIPCPHAGKCALAPMCGAQILRSYIELHGAEEFQAVSAYELVQAMHGEQS